jgi:formylglycine-generating enzyme required for sulfatase activity
MPVLFISHSSKDDARVDALADWLRANGFSDIFVDHQSIAGGAKWPEALRASAGSCRVVICFVTSNWLASPECFNEFGAAWYMGKRIIPLFLLPASTKLNEEAKTRLDRVRAEDQGIDLKSCMPARGALAIDADQNVAKSLKTGLRAAGAHSRVGLDPEAFDIDLKLRPTPFPGLSSFGDDDADAALFYGRSREIADVLEELRKVRAERDLRPLVILGASGAGKSSLLKAGIIPRLRREAPAWLPLRTFRPGADPLLNFAEALARTFVDFGRSDAHGVIRDRLMDVWSKAERANKGELTPSGLAALEAALEAEGQGLRNAAGRPNASILISVDQAEEVARADDKSGEALADYLRAALETTSSPWQLALTIRTDSFPELQSHRRFQNLKARGYDLRALPVFRFDSVVEEPAKRYGVEVDTVLVDALMDDAPKEDALPLLAFALQRLWRQYATSGKLTKDNYDKVGGLNGLIEDAAERALRGLEPEQDVPLPSAPPVKRRVELGASTFVPALVQISDQGATIRRVAAWTGFSDEQQELLSGFDRWRLVVRKGEADGGTVEVAHEALFREWSRLKTWLKPERARLEVLRSLQMDAASWDRNGRDTAFLNHKDRKRLGEATEVLGIERYRQRLGQRELDYVADCQAAERLAHHQTRRVQALVGTLAALLALAGVGWWRQDFLRDQYYWRAKMGPHALTVAQEKEKAANPGSDFKECATGCPTMIVVPAGKFMMGSPESEKDRSKDEGPPHEVTIAKPIAVGKTELTFAEWDACVAAGACAKVPDQGWGRGNQPVINVSWEDARQYVAWLSRITGKEYRLLSEAEWEYAARAGNSGRYGRLSMRRQEIVHTEGQQQIPAGGYFDDGQYVPFSDKTPGSKERYSFSDDDEEVRLDQQAWYAGNSDNKPHPVGKKAANAFGLSDMHGNVWEWVEDVWHDSYEGAPTDGSPWVQGGEANGRVVRGGSWFNYPRVLRAAGRIGFASDDRYFGIGFRLARTLNP